MDNNLFKTSDAPQAIPLSQKVKESIFSEYLEARNSLKKIASTNSIRDWHRLRGSLLALYLDVKPKLALYPDKPEFKELLVLEKFVSNPSRFMNCNQRGQYIENYLVGGVWKAFTKEDTMRLLEVMRVFLEVNGVMSYEEKRPETSLDNR